MAKVVKVHYCTEDKIAKINPENIKLYDKYLKSNIIKNKDVKDTTYLVYQNYFQQFLVYLSEEWDNIGLYDDDFMENAVDIMEGFIAFCQETLQNNKKIINTKLSAVSSFYLWSMKRRIIPYHPFDKRLDRMKGADKEKIISTYFLSHEETDTIINTLVDSVNNGGDYDFVDLLLFKIMYDSANRIGAIVKLTLSSLDLDNNCFKDVREKEGYIVDIAFDDDTKELIEQWLIYRKENMDNLECDGFFIARYKESWKPLVKGTLQSRIKKIGKIIGIDDYRSHCMRKTKSNQLLDDGVDPLLVSRLLNHKDLSTLKFYRKEKSSVEIKDEIKKQLSEIKKKKELNKENETV